MSISFAVMERPFEGSPNGLNFTDRTLTCAYWLQKSFTRRDAKGQVVTEFNKSELSAYEVRDIDGDEGGDGVNRTDASLLGESGTSTDVTSAP
jgi:hypothetical protein